MQRSDKDRGLESRDDPGQLLGVPVFADAVAAGVLDTHGAEVDLANSRCVAGSRFSAHRSRSSRNCRWQVLESVYAAAGRSPVPEDLGIGRVLRGRPAPLRRTPPRPGVR